MLSRTAVAAAPQLVQVRGMATLRDISLRLKAVKNIQKITKSMKIVSAAKFARAERELRAARPYGAGAAAFYDKAEVTQDEKKPVHLIVAVSSDKGLCGGIHTNIFKAIRASVPEKPAGTEVKIIAVGDKQRAALSRLYQDKILFHFKDVGRKPVAFQDAAKVANSILDLEFDHGELYYNKFNSVVSYTPTRMPVYNKDHVAAAEKINLYDSIDEDVLQSYNEFALTNLIYYAMKEGITSEQSARMTAMEAATKNAGEMIEKLSLLFNRKRQAVITSELIEIISGAAALK